MPDGTRTRLSRTLAVVVAALTVLSMVGGVATAAGTTTISVTTADQTLAPGDTTTVQVVVDDADGGVGAGQVGVQLTDPSVATITDVTVENDPGNENTNVADDGDSATTTFAFADSADTGSVTVLTVTIEADAVGSTDVAVVAPSAVSDSSLGLVLADEQGSEYDFSSVGAATVEVANAPPTADAGTDQSAGPGDTVTLDATDSSDPNGDDLSYSWTETTNSGVTLTGAQTAQPSFTAPSVTDQTTLTFQVEVTDTHGESDTDTVSVTVSDVNEPPVADFTVVPSSPTAGEQVTFDASSSTDDGGIDDYQWEVSGVDAGGPTQTTLLDSDFESGSLATDGWTHDPTSAQAAAGVSDATSNSGSQAAFHRSGSGSIVSPDLDASSADSLSVSYWVQKGSEAFSENPDAGAGEDLVVEYLADSGDWIEVDRIEDSVESGAAFSESLTLDDADALHDDFQLRFRQQAGSSDTGDYWHVDDVSVTATSGDSAGPVQLSGETATHTFDEAGTYDVTLTVTDDAGLTVSDTVTVTVDEDGDPQPSPDKSTSVSLVPATAETTVDAATTFDVVVDTADGGVGAYSATVSLDDASVATITDVALHGSPASQTQDVTIAGDGSSVTIHAALMDTDDTGSVTIATVTLEGATPGSTTVSTGVSALADEAGNEYDVTSTGSATLTVTEVVVGDFTDPVTDTDGDGAYEDVDGDGEFDIVDVQALFANLDDDAVQDNPDKFDFNGDGTVDVVDVQALFAELTDD